ncbi:MAG: hypothetical protein V4579_07660 [Pseudomonadota bacterium]
MKLAVLLGIVALVPAALNVSPAARALTVPVCTGERPADAVSIPLPDGGQRRDEGPGCCAKACHTGSRKKSSKLPN